MKYQEKNGQFYRQSWLRNSMKISRYQNPLELQVPVQYTGTFIEHPGTDLNMRTPMQKTLPFYKSKKEPKFNPRSWSRELELGAGAETRSRS